MPQERVKKQTDVKHFVETNKAGGKNIEEVISRKRNGRRHMKQ